MTARMRHWKRRGESNNLSNRLAAIRRNRPKNPGSIEVNLLGQGRFREMVAVALFLTSLKISLQVGVRLIERSGVGVG